MVFLLNFEISKIASLPRVFYRGKGLDKEKEKKGVKTEGFSFIGFAQKKQVSKLD